MLILSKIEKRERVPNMKEWEEKKYVPISKSLLYKKLRRHMNGKDIGELWHTKGGRPIGSFDTKPRELPRQRTAAETLENVESPNGETQFNFLEALESLDKMYKINRV